VILENGRCAVVWLVMASLAAAFDGSLHLVIPLLYCTRTPVHTAVQYMYCNKWRLKYSILKMMKRSDLGQSRASLMRYSKQLSILLYIVLYRTLPFSTVQHE
jgi:hypothetical protein